MSSAEASVGVISEVPAPVVFLPDAPHPVRAAVRAAPASNSVIDFFFIISSIPKRKLRNRESNLKFGSAIKEICDASAQISDLKIRSSDLFLNLVSSFLGKNKTAPD